ncbi:unnamed protein product [Brassica oleracea var. botrytis]|uniref:ENT domain-containing protein n=3 Tax=Brassica TaxID=3705 RepID=A0A8S9RDP2_BRACR|nr:hypothetical protein F2Q69_00062606 [Brassica cretica]CAF2113832.1 unnamed protein product [Brassica napus]VDD58196.1 unnamed protein product [Brassica oleracea]
MRFRKGSIVEVLTLKEAPYGGGWRAAEILAGNGHTYSVRYYSYGLAKDEALEERAARKSIRPCPPQIDVGRWEAALELTVHKVNFRARQCWQDETWVMIGKVSCSVKSSTLTGSDVNPNLKPHETSLKRPSSCDWCESAESFTGSPKKLRSCRSGSSVCNGCCDDTDACSVGSCNPVRYDESDDTSTSFLDGSSSQEAGSCSSDAESSKGVREEATGGTVRRSCRPELYTYRSTLGKLFASGPLDWNQEASLTDLRLSLNISTDEHLMEIRNLKSTHSKFC